MFANKREKPKMSARFFLHKIQGIYIILFKIRGALGNFRDLPQLLLGGELSNFFILIFLNLSHDSIHVN
jgi:hypothetical protein